MRSWQKCVDDIKARLKMQPSATMKRKSVLSTTCLALAAGGLILVCLTPPAHADGAAPFQFDTGHWMSFEHYKENLRYGRPTPNNLDNTPMPTPPSDDKATVATTAPTVATPSRPINLPVMPGINKGYDINVGSTTDDSAVPEAQITDMDGTPDLHLQSQNWQSASEAARHNAQIHDGGDGDHERAPLDIRMSYLPNQKITPVNPPAHKSNHGRPMAGQVAQAVPVQPPKSPAEAAACAAIDAYKKKQLEALQSDRQTLTALQTAITQLGLEKQLNFLTNTQGSINAEAQSASVKMDTPAPSASAQP